MRGPCKAGSNSFRNISAKCEMTDGHSNLIYTYCNEQHRIDGFVRWMNPVLVHMIL